MFGGQGPILAFTFHASCSVNKYSTACCRARDGEWGSAILLRAKMDQN